jgi:hypothetical protein
MKLLMVPMRFRTPRRLTFAFGWLVSGRSTVRPRIRTCLRT